MAQKLWVGLTAHDPLNRIDSTLKAIRCYSDYDLDVSVRVYINYEAQDDVDTLKTIFQEFAGHLDIDVVVASPGYEGWYLTWAHKLDLAMAVLRREYDYFIYQENDMLINKHNFNYWIAWKNRLSGLNLEPGFVRFEKVKNLKVPFDNHFVHPLTGEVAAIWGERGFKVPTFLVVDHNVKVFTQLSNPYYGAMILDLEMAQRYIRSGSYDPQQSAEIVSYRNWPIADRSSMGLAFEDPPVGLDHRRCVPLIHKDGKYMVPDYALLEHDDVKYSTHLMSLKVDLLDCADLFSLGSVEG